MKHLVAILSVLLLSACAPALSGHEMMPRAQSYDQINNAPALNKNININQVQAAKGAGGGVAPVTAENFQEALTFALRQTGWYAANKGKYRLDAEITEIDQPAFGLDFTVKVTARYKLTRTSDGRVVYDDILTLPCTVRFGEAFNAEIRLRKATGCAVGENITHLLKVLTTRRI